MAVRHRIDPWKNALLTALVLCWVYMIVRGTQFLFAAVTMACGLIWGFVDSFKTLL